MQKRDFFIFDGLKTTIREDSIGLSKQVVKYVFSFLFQMGCN